MTEKEKYIQDFNNGLHRLGRTLMVTTIALLIAVPFVFGAIFDTTPDLKGFLAAYFSANEIAIGQLLLGEQTDFRATNRAIMLCHTLFLLMF